MDKKNNATKFCMNCGKELAFNAKTCPQCGYDCKPKRPFFKSVYFWLIIGVFFGAGIAHSEENNSPNNNQKEIQTTNSFQETDKDTPTPKQYLEITSDKLIEEVETNALKAQDDYEGKNVAVTGKLTSIDDFSKNTRDFSREMNCKVLQPMIKS